MVLSDNQVNMKKRVLFYCAAVIATFSMQSCVTNYVVSAPTTYPSEYKSNAKLASIDNKKLAIAKDQLLNSFKGEDSDANNNLGTLVQNKEVLKAVRFSQKIDEILTEAESYLGTPYRYGGTTRNGIDCSAFVLSVFGATAGMTLPRVAASQAKEGETVEKSDLQKGDLVFFSQGRGRISHVGIVESVTEDGQINFIHAATSKGVMISSLDNSYWGPKFRFAKRVLSQEVFNENMANNALN